MSAGTLSPVRPVASPAEAAQNTLRNCGQEVSFPVNPVQIARSMGLEVYRATLDQGHTSGMLLKAAGQPACVYVARGDALVRQRFTVAHEIGHYVLLAPGTDDAFEMAERRDARASLGTDPSEVFANGFAAELLMPGVAVRKCHALGLSVNGMSEFFSVSADAMVNRLNTLRLCG